MANGPERRTLQPRGRVAAAIFVLTLTAGWIDFGAAQEQDRAGDAAKNATEEAAKAIDAARKAADAAHKAADAAKPAPDARKVAQPALQLQQRVRVRAGGRFGRANIPAEDEHFVLFPINREMLRNLEQAKQLLKTDQAGDGFALIDRLLREDHDFFYQPDRESQHHRSIKAEVRKVLSELPPEALTKYELQFGHQARHDLDEATSNGDLAKVAAVSRRYFHTSAGFEATLLIARHYLDHGHAVAAALALQLLHETPEARRTLDPGLSLSLAMCWMRAGIPARAELALREMKGNRPTIRVGDNAFPSLADNTKALQWLSLHAAGGANLHTSAVAAWTFHGGNSSRSAVSTGGSPLLTSPRWQQPLSIEPRGCVALQHAAAIDGTGRDRLAQRDATGGG